MYGIDFNRSAEDNTNKALDYGYSILLSIFNREIVKKGYITPFGINHRNEFNQFNLSCDLMESFRPLIDEIVYNNREFAFEKTFKLKLIDVSNVLVRIDGREQYVSNAIPIFIIRIFNYIENEEESKILNYEF